MTAFEAHHQDPRTMHPKELVRALMRGDSATFKAGYSAANAVLAVREIQAMNEQVDSAEVKALEAYAEGFAAGMAEDRERISPA